MEEELDRFRAVAGDGQVYVVIQYGRVVRSTQLSGGEAPLMGSKRLALSDGRNVNRVEGDPDAFQIVSTNEIIRKIG